MRALTALLLLALAAACSGGSEAGEGEALPTDMTAAAGGLGEVVGAIVDQQVTEGVPESPLGRVVETCPLTDDAALEAMADVVGADPVDAEVLRATIADPDGAPAVSCPIRFGEASAGAVVLGAVPSEADIDRVRERILAGDFVEPDDVDLDGLPVDRALLVDATGFESRRAVWVADGMQVSVTANADVVEAGQLPDLLRVAVREVQRVLGRAA